MASQENLFYTLQKVSVDTAIMHYMKLDYLLELLDRRKFYVSLKKNFKDKNEISPPLKHMFPVYQARVDIPDNKLREDLNHMQSKYKDYKDLQDIPASCWTLKPFEDFLMWKSYTSMDRSSVPKNDACGNDIYDYEKELGICIKTTIGNVVASLTYPDFDIFCGKMIYQNYPFYRNKEAFTKSVYFRGEEEFRFYFVPQDTAYKPDDHIELDVNPDVLIDEVILSPFFKKVESERIANVLSARYNIKCRLSGIELIINDEKK